MELYRVREKDLAEEKLFLRKSSGLVRQWSMLDIFVYNSWSWPTVLAAWIFSYCIFFPLGNIPLAILLIAILCGFQVTVYPMLISAMPRAGGDYVWQSRMLHGGIAFVFLMVGWFLALSMWVPIISQYNTQMFLSPYLFMLGYRDLAIWLRSMDAMAIGTFISIGLMVLILLTGVKASMAVTRYVYYANAVGLVIFFVIFALSSQDAFVANWNAMMTNTYGYQGNAYEDTIAAGQAIIASDYGAYIPKSVWDVPSIDQTLKLVPMLAFYAVWSMWGSPMYGEVRRATDFKRAFLSMQVPNILWNALAAAYVILSVNVMGFEFWQSSNLLFWYQDFNLMPVFPFPPAFAYLLMPSNVALYVVGFVVLTTMAFTFMINMIASWGTFRVIFAMSFDRLLPAWLANVNEKGVPYWVVLFYYGIVCIPTTAAYFWVPGVYQIFLAATLVLTNVFFFTSIAGAIYPYRMRDHFNRSPISKYKFGGVPVITIAGIVSAAFMLWLLIMYAIDPTYGVNNLVSVQYMVILYVGCAVYYAIVHYYRKRQGIDLNVIFKAVPVE